jgi:uncharacterized membrane protein YccC
MRRIPLEPAPGMSKGHRAAGVSKPNLLSAICCLLFHSGAWAGMNWTRQDLFGDLKVRHGIKLGIAGLLALLCTQALRLPDDNWAILTVQVLMSGQFVGAFAFKGVMRMAGTLAGAIVGVWLVSDYISAPAIFLPLFFLVMALAGYKFGQVGTRQVPYAYFLLGLTTITIVTDGMTKPEQAWQVGLDRTEEIFVGIICSLLISTLVWPRYAREEFFDAGRDALKTVGRLMSMHTFTSLHPTDAPLEIEQLQDVFDKQVARLRTLFQAGARESAVFSARLANYSAFLVALNDLFHAGLALNRHRGEAWFLEHVQFELESLFTAISDEFGILIRTISPGKKLPPSQINEAFAVFEAKVNQILAQGILLKAPLQTAMDFAGEIAALRRLRDELNNIRSAIEGLPRFGQLVPEEKAHWKLLPTIDWLWVRIGIKGGLAAVTAIVCLKWIHPPGPANVPTWAWLFVVLRRTFFRLGGTSDLRSFETAVYGSLILAGAAALLVFLTPLLASYAVMNVALFAVLFVTGFFTARTTGTTFWSEFTFLTTSVFVALNPQVPVPSQTIVESFVGTIFGLWIATLVSRLIWPLLPQRILKDSLNALFVQMKALFAGDPGRKEIMIQLTDLPVEALGTLRQIQLAGCSQQEKAKLSAVVRSLQRVASRLSQLVSRRGRTPEIAQEILKPRFEAVEIEFLQLLDAFAICFREGDCRRGFPTVRGALLELDYSAQEIRDRNLLDHLPSEASLRFFDIIHDYHATAEALEECSRLIGALQIEQYWGDYRL